MFQRTEVLTVHTATNLNREDTAPDDVVRVHNKTLAGIGRNSHVKITNVDNGRSIVARVWGTGSNYQSEAGKVLMHYDQLSELGVTSWGDVSLSGVRASLKDVMNYQAQQGDMTALATKWSIISGIGAVSACFVSLVSIFI